MIDYNDFIEDYIKGLLNETENNAFEKALLIDKKLAQEVATQRVIIESLKQHKLREKVKSNFAKISELENKRTTTFNFKWAAIFIGVVFASSLAYLIFENKHQQSFTFYDGKDKNENNHDFDTENNSLNNSLDTSKSVNNKSELLAENSNRQEQNEFEPKSHLRSINNDKTSDGSLIAQEFFDETPEIVFKNPVDSSIFYQGINSFRIGKYEEAGALFLKIEETSNIYPYSQWFYALTLLARERYDTFIIMAEDMADDDSFIYQNKAIQVLDKLKVSNK